MTEQMRRDRTEVEDRILLLRLRADLSSSTVSTCVCWLAQLDPSITHAYPMFEHALDRFGQAWFALAAKERPLPTIEATLDGYLDDLGLDELRERLRAMFLDGLLVPVVIDLTDFLTRDPRLGALGSLLLALHVATQHDGGSDQCSGIVAQIGETLQGAASKGLTLAAMQGLLNRCGNATNGPQIEVNAIAA